MTKNQFMITLIFAFGFSITTNAQTVYEEDIQDFDEASGVGCINKEPVTDSANYYFVCRSRHSGENAWNAALYRGKIACKKDKFSVLFNVPPSLPTENEIYGAQVEIKCATKP